MQLLLRHKLHESLPSVTCPEMNMFRNFFVAAIVARSRSPFYSNCTINIARHLGMFHKATIQATCVATKLQDKLQEKLPSVTAPQGHHKEILELFQVLTLSQSKGLALKTSALKSLYGGQITLVNSYQLSR